MLYSILLTAALIGNYLLISAEAVVCNGPSCIDDTLGSEVSLLQHSMQVEDASQQQLQAEAGTLQALQSRLAKMNRTEQELEMARRFAKLQDPNLAKQQNGAAQFEMATVQGTDEKDKFMKCPFCAQFMVPSVLGLQQQTFLCSFLFTEEAEIWHKLLSCKGCKSKLRQRCEDVASEAKIANK